MPPRKRVFDKKNAQNFQLVFRSQNDPRIHDPDAPDMVFAEVQAPNSNKHRNDDWDAPTSSGASTVSVSQNGKIKSRRDLEGEFAGRVRQNEGEAANYGVFYDDSKYDYMQHLRELGTSSNATFVPAKSAEEKGKRKMKLEDMLENMNMGDGRSEADMSMTSTASSSAADLFGEDLAPSEFVRPSTYQDQQNIPDAIAGFQPDMDPRLREVLEALEDDAYVDDEEDFFDELAKDAHEVDSRDWQDEDDFEDDDGWATDDTIKPAKETKSSRSVDAVSADGVELPPADGPAPDMDDGDGDWMAEFNKFKKDAKASKAQKQPAAPSEMQSFVTGTDMTGARRKKRKGAKTSTSNYSMTSSALFRTDQQSLLDERFDKIEEEYADDGFGDDDMSLASGMSGISVYSKASEMGGQAPGLRTDFDSILDEFSNQHAGSGRKRGHKKNGYKDGLAQLDEVRKGLGPAKFRQSSRAR
ncbi:low-temperature viability protein ltv1 [Phyllosticta capitalensis]